MGSGGASETAFPFCLRADLLGIRIPLRHEANSVTRADLRVGNVNFELLDGLLGPVGPPQRSTPRTS